MFFIKSKDKIFSDLKIENKQLNEELNEYKKLFKSIYYYAGGYPNWKAQQEYREILLSEKGEREFQDPEPLDDYLGRIVDATKELINKMGMPESKDFRWSDDLSEARGDYLKRKLDALSSRSTA